MDQDPNLAYGQYSRTAIDARDRVRHETARYLKQEQWLDKIYKAFNLSEHGKKSEIMDEENLKDTDGRLAGSNVGQMTGLGKNDYGEEAKRLSDLKTGDNLDLEGQQSALQTARKMQGRTVTVLDDHVFKIAEYHAFIRGAKGEFYDSVEDKSTLEPEVAQLPAHDAYMEEQAKKVHNWSEDNYKSFQSILDWEKAADEAVKQDKKNKKQDENAPTVQLDNKTAALSPILETGLQNRKDAAIAKQMGKRLRKVGKKNGMKEEQGWGSWLGTKGGGALMSAVTGGMMDLDTQKVEGGRKTKIVFRIGAAWTKFREAMDRAEVTKKAMGDGVAQDIWFWLSTLAAALGALRDLLTPITLLSMLVSIFVPPAALVTAGVAVTSIGLTALKLLVELGLTIWSGIKGQQRDVRKGNLAKNEAWTHGMNTASDGLTLVGKGMTSVNMFSNGVDNLNFGMNHTSQTMQALGQGDHNLLPTTGRGINMGINETLSLPMHTATKQLVKLGGHGVNKIGTDNGDQTMRAGDRIDNMGPKRKAPLQWSKTYDSKDESKFYQGFTKDQTGNQRMTPEHHQRMQNQNSPQQDPQPQQNQPQQDPNKSEAAPDKILAKQESMKKSLNKLVNTISEKGKGDPHLEQLDRILEQI